MLLEVLCSIIVVLLLVLCVICCAILVFVYRVERNTFTLVYETRRLKEYVAFTKKKSRRDSRDGNNIPRVGRVSPMQSRSSGIHGPHSSMKSNDDMRATIHRMPDQSHDKIECRDYKVFYRPGSGERTE